MLTITKTGKKTQNIIQLKTGLINRSIKIKKYVPMIYLLFFSFYIFL